MTNKMSGLVTWRMIQNTTAPMVIHTRIANPRMSRCNGAEFKGVPDGLLC